MARLRRGVPWLTAYWFRSARMAWMAASLTKSGPAKSGKPCPRLTAPCYTASRLISVNTDVPKPATRLARRSAMSPGPEFRRTYANLHPNGHPLEHNSGHSTGSPSP